MGLKLPLELETFYLHANGGMMPDGYEYNHEGLFTVSYVVIYNLDFLKSAYLSNKSADKYYKTKDYCSDYLIPFCNLGLNQICIAFSGKNIGKIFWLGDPGDGFPIHILADSLEGFLSKLKPA